MYECPNCGGNLKFDIASQMLSCAFCNTQVDPYSVSEEKDAEEDNAYDVTVFTCPQCAGEIYSTDNTAAGFCSFCGASTILNSRIQKEKRPEYIIPFKQTKEDCKKAYTRLIKRAVFAPKELKDEKYIDSFRGIYMPYWVYHISQQGPIRLLGKQESRDGDYILVKHYDVLADINFDYNRMLYDASSSFADDISRRVAPFETEKMKDFTPSFLSGFYADTADVESAVYEEVAGRKAKDWTIDFIRKYPETAFYQIEDNDNEMEKKLHTRFESRSSAMLPVWFLAYRNKERVAYVTVNGQTGKVAADLPADIGKYLLGSLLLAVPLFLLFDLFFTLRPTVLLPVICILSAVSVVLHAMEMKKIAGREQYADDVGARAAKRQKAMEENAPLTRSYFREWEKKDAKKNAEEALKQKKRQKREKWKGIITDCLIFVLALVWVSLTDERSKRVGLDFWHLSESVISGAGHVFILAALVVSLIACRKGFSYARGIKSKKGLPGSLWALLGIVAAVVVDIWHPAADYYYYGAVLISLFAISLTLVDLMRCYNFLATRRPPQFNYRGGDDRA